AAGRTLAGTALSFGGGLLGERFGVDVDDGRADRFGDLREAVREGGGRGDDERFGVGGINGGLFLAADAARQDGADEDAGRERRKEGECGAEAVVAHPLEQAWGGVSRCIHR